MKSDNYYFVYTLSHNERIFYVGKCKDVVKRYAQHLNNKKDTELAKYIQSILLEQLPPRLNIITFKPDIEAASIEETLIKLMTVGGQKLFNCQHSRLPGAKGLPTTKKEIRKSIKQAQDEYIKMANSFRSYYSPSIRKAG